MQKTKYLLFLLLCTFILINPVSATDATAELGFCEETGILRTFQLIGYGIYILKILVPLGIVILGMIDFSKAIIASDDSAIKKSTSALIKRVVAGVIIFLAPTIVGYIFTLVSEAQSNESKYTACVECLTDPSSCVIKED